MDGKIFNSQGVHVATVRGSTIFSLRGEKLYDLRGINIYKLSGELVGHLASAGASEKYLLREADVGSQSADTIKLGFSSCLGRKQKNPPARSGGPVSADLSPRPCCSLPPAPS